jgi:hypothetical protein
MACLWMVVPSRERPVRFHHAPSTDLAGDIGDDCRGRSCHPNLCTVAGHAGSASTLVVALPRSPAAWVGIRHRVEMGLGGNGMRGLRHYWPRGRPCYSREYSWRTRGIQPHACAERGQREREFRADRIRRPRVLDDLTGIRASRIPPSQSSFPFAIFTVLTDGNPASFNHAVVSASE